MDSPPECVLSLSNDIPQSPPTLPSLDHSPQTQPSPPDSPSVLPLQSPEPSPQSPSTTPSFPLSPFGLDPDDNPQEDSVENEEDEESEGLDGVPASPTPAVALFPGGGGQEAGCSPILDSSPPSTPSAPPLGFGALEVALSAGQKSTEELDLQLFQKDTIVTKPHLGVVGSVASSPALRFPCHVCGKRFRFQSILSLHARAHSLDRRASAIYRTSFPAAPLKQHLKVQQNIKDSFHINQSNQRLLPNNLIHLMQDEESDIKELEGLQSDLNPNFLLDGSTPLTPPLTEDPITSPYASNQIGETSTSNAPAFRCHACKGKFRTASELARHVRILHNPYKCTLCPFSASQEEILASHLQESHPAPDTPPAYIARPIVASPETPIPTPSHTPAPNQQASQTIGAAAASPAVPAFRCETCGQRFTQSWFLKGHMRKHKDSLDHKCQVCGRGFKEPWFLKNHMKVHLNKLGLKSGLAGSLGTASSTEQLKGAQSNQLNALYSSLLLAQRGGGGRGRADRESRLGMGSSKSAILGYLGLPSDGGGSSCMERLQAVAQVAEMGNGGSIGGVEQRKAGGNSESPGGLSEAGDQAAWWQLVARSIAVAQQQQQQQSRPQQRAQKGPGRNSMISEADQVRAYLSGINQREESGSTGANAGSWECPDCGKLFRSLQQVVVHAKVHAQRGQKSGAVGGGGEEDTIAKSHCAAGVAGLARSEALRQELHSGGTSSQQTGEARQGSKTHIGGVHIGGAQQAALATGFHSVISNFKGENGLPSVSTMPALPSRERVRGRGIKDCPYCGKAFRSSHHLKVHLRVHTGERPYKCPHCDYAGTQSGSLKYHLQRHHREQRNALAAAAAANSSSAGLTAALNSHSLASGAMIIKRRSQQSHGPINRSSTDTHASRTSNQQSPYGLLGFPDQNNHHKALSALKDVDLESQYRYLSGMMGTLYQEGNWIRESPPQKVQKVSRRKPLTTSRMVQPTKDGPPKQEGGFEPLDLSRRTPPLGGAEEDGMVSFGDFESEQTGIMLSQCVFCPFRTSSAELMAMHLQVNHTSKSRRKRSPPVALDVDGNAKLLKSEAINPVSPGMWKDMSGSDNQALDTWSEAASSHTHNGLLSDPVTQDGNLSENVVNHFKEIEDDNQEEYLVGHLNESSLENSPGADQDTGMSGSVSPAAISNVEEDDELD